jgi:hypothetical protein
VPSSGCRHWLLVLGGMFMVIFELGPWWAPNVGIKKSGGTPSMHGNDAKVDYQRMVDAKVTRTRQMVINALGSLPRGESKGAYL